MSGDDGQLELLNAGRVQPMSVELQEEIVRRCRDRLDALWKSYEVSGLAPKQVFEPLGINQATFSKIQHGNAFLDPQKQFAWMDLVGNEIPLRFDAFRRGYELVPVKTSLEAENERLRGELAEQGRVMARLVEMLRR